MVAKHNNKHEMAAFAKRLNQQYSQAQASFAEFDASIAEEIKSISLMRDRGDQVIPELSCDAIVANGITDTQQQQIRQRGCVIVRGVCETAQVDQWNVLLHEYLDHNNYYATLQEDIDAAHPVRKKHPNMLDIFWSPSQIEARQSARLCQLQKELNNLWSFSATGKGSLQGQNVFSYADRARIREPLDQLHGLKPHVDSCSLESWFDPDHAEAKYGDLLRGQWQGFSAFNAAGREHTQTKPYEEACGVFRTFQGWMALTEQGANSGTLQLIPSSRCVAWLFLSSINSLLDSTLENTYPELGHSFSLQPQSHGRLLAGLCSIPTLYPGDTVWWHPDVVHAVEYANSSVSKSSVMFLGSTPDCNRNRQYLESQVACFEHGLSPPDFPAIHAEQFFEGRATLASLNDLGKQIMGIV